MLTVLSKVEGLTTLSQPVESLKVERVEWQYRKFNILVSFSVKLAAFHASSWADTRHLKPENFIFLFFVPSCHSD